MIRRSQICLLALCAAAGMVTAACGEASFSPTGPSSVSGTAGGAVITGTVVGASSAMTAADSGSGSPGSVTVSVAGTNIVSGLDSVGRFRLNGVPAGPIQLQFRGGGIEATITLTVATGERIDLSVRVTSTGIRIEAERRERGDSGAQMEGHITAIDAAARTIRVAGALVEVPASTVIRHEDRTLTFADLHVGDEVAVRATVDGSRVIATEIKVKVDDDDDEGDDEDDDGARFVELEGVVSALAGTCPEISFTLRAVTVRTNRSTIFEDGGCTRVQNGRELHVKGSRQADGSLLAVKVEIED